MGGRLGSWQADQERVVKERGKIKEIRSWKLKERICRKRIMTSVQGPQKTPSEIRKVFLAFCSQEGCTWGPGQAMFQPMECREPK